MSATPSFFHPDFPQLFIKHEGGGIHPGHKFRSAAWLVERAVRDGVDVSRTADRSSGSWAMGLSYAVRLCGGAARLVSVGEPPRVVRSFVEANGGEFDIVSTNRERVGRLEGLIGRGYWSPDQHNNGGVIDAFALTVGPEMVADLERHGVNPAFLVAPVGTGGLLAGTARAMRAAGMQFVAVGVDIASSLTHPGPRSWKPAQVKMRGVGSDDEVCHTLRTARAYVNEIVAVDHFAAAQAMREFFRRSTAGCGMSGGLALAAMTRHILDRCPAGRHVVVLLPDRGELYAEELHAANLIFG